MSDPGANLLTKVMAVGMLGLIASMGLLLFTLRVAKPVDEQPVGEVLSPLAFEARLQRGEVLECSYAVGRLSGIRRGIGAERISFRVEGEIRTSLIDRIVRAGVRIRRPGPPPPRAEP